MKLNLGFESFPYSARYTARSPLKTRVSAKARRQAKYQDYGQGATSGQVAKELEERYKIVDAFYEKNEDLIIELIEEHAAMDLEEVLTMGEPSKKGLSFKETDKIEKKFVDDLKQRAYDGNIYKVPTKASVKEGRPSFFKTGLYASSFRAWMEE